MLTPELAKYNEMYAQFVSEFISMYNTNRRFYITASREPGVETRLHLRHIATLAKQLQNQSMRCYKERQQILKDEKKAAKAYKNQKSPVIGILQTRKKNGFNKLSTDSPI